MRVVSQETTEKNRVTLTIEVTEAEFEPALEKAYRKNVGRMNLPGFRKGKAPRKMLERMYGAGVFFEDAVNESYFKAYLDAVEETGLEPVDHPDVEMLDIAATGYSFKAVITTKPEVKLGRYKGLSAVRPAAVVGEDEIDAEVGRLRQRNASVQTAERAARTGDSVVFDFAGTMDGVPFEGGSAEKHKLTLGSGQFIPGFEEQLVGKSADEEFDVEVNFPDDYHAEELAGKPAVFHCFLHEVQESLLPELDDEFAKDVSEYDTLEELRNSIRERIYQSREREMKQALEEALLDQVIAGLEVDVPDVMVDHQLEDMLRDLEYRLRGQMRVDLQSYLAMTGDSLEGLKAERRPFAERQVKATLAFEAIAEAEGIAVTDEELEAEYAKIADSYRTDVDTIKKQISRDGLTQDIRLLKASQIITENAEVIEEGAKPKPKSKAKAKPAPSEEDAKPEAKPKKRSASK